MYRKPKIVLQNTLYNKTIHLLRNRPKTITLKRISDETGLPYAWLCSLSQPRNNPTVARVETLYSYLTKKPLFDDIL